MAPNLVTNYGTFTVTLEDLEKLISPQEIEWLEQKRSEQMQLKFDREIVQENLDKLLHRIYDLDDQLDMEPLSDEEFQSQDSLRNKLNLQHQQMAERLVRIGKQLARATLELKNRGNAVYEDLLARGVI
ncbi:uncharacterized protein LOC108107805 [Drosophila eugracilis]|uniref:uncharacterized protein LOC108107805 n=1 Tax=Drosophila eugracilis TaxID=29029 RepID=UPI0007E7F481|nr:uncharacterized protein LOC108107805 [Drosophila eugracilis]